MTSIPFPSPPADTDEVLALRTEFRAFLDRELAGRSPRARSDNWYGFDRGFSRAMGQAGYLGMTWPKQYGGHERSAFERYVVVEETLAYANMFRATQAQAAAMGASGLRTLSDGDIANPSALDGLKVIVLPEVKGLSDAQRATLAGWVKGGGGLVSLYFDGRDDQAGIPLTRRGLGGANRWGLLSPAFGARFLNDAFMEQASFALEAGHPLIAKAAAFCGGPVPDYAWRRRSGPTALTGELVSSAGSGFQPIGRLRSARITYQPAERRATPGAVFAFTNTYGAGRLVHFGFNFIDAWQPWTFQSYYRAVDPGAPNTGVALLRGSVEWAAGRA